MRERERERERETHRETVLKVTRFKSYSPIIPMANVHFVVVKSLPKKIANNKRSIKVFKV